MPDSTRLRNRPMKPMLLRSYVWVLLGCLGFGLYNPAAAQNNSSSKVAQSDPDDQSQPPDFTQEVVEQVLSRLQRGAESHNPDQVLSAFDPERTTNYAQLRDQILAFFARYRSIQLRYQVLQVATEKGRGSAVADIDMDAIPFSDDSVALRRSLQLRMQLAPVRKVWKLVSFEPQDLFSE